jgi:hypothetical protein
MGQAMADHSISSQKEEHAQDGASYGHEDSGQEGPLQESIGEERFHQAPLLMGV